MSAAGDPARERAGDPERRSAPRAAGRTAPRDPAGLCPRCAKVKVVVSDRGSRFYRCGLAEADPRFPRYPPQPVVACSGFAE